MLDDLFGKLLQLIIRQFTGPEPVGEPGIGTIFGDEYKQGGHVIAGTAKVYAAMVAELSPHAPAALREA